MSAFSARDRLIAYTLQFNSGMPLKPFAEALKLREHVVRYALERMLDAGAMKEVAWLDLYRLGFLNHHVLFSVAGSERQQAALVSYLSSSPYTAWFAELGGQFRYGANIASRSLRGFARFLELLDTKFGSILMNKQISTIVSFRLFTKRYLAPEAREKESIRIGLDADPVRLDELDVRIIEELRGPRIPSVYEIAARLKVPRSTLQTRIMQLKRSGIIRRMLYFIPAGALGAHTYKVYLWTKGDRRAANDAVLEFCSTHPHVVNLASCLGSWDCDMTVEVFAPQDMARVLNDLNTKLGEFVNRLEVLPVYRQMQSPFFLRKGVFSPEASPQ